MSPMDEFSWFATPFPTNLSVTAASTVTLLAVNPRRVALLISNAGANTLWVSTDPNLQALPAQGMRLAVDSAPLILWQHDLGNIVQSAWFGISVGVGTNVSLIEVLLRDWPENIRGQTSE